MNVIGSRPDGWWRDRAGAIERLAAQLERWAEHSGERVTVVLEQQPRRPLPAERVEVEWAAKPGRDAADGEIVRRLGEWLAEAKAGGDAEGAVVVVTSDRALAAAVREAGAAVEPSSRFRAALEEL
jgi:uncharacterized protein YaiI (UPF0178 family)